MRQPINTLTHHHIGSMKIADLRREYALRELSEADVDPDPIKQFGLWFKEARDCNIEDANAMSLATADRQGKPSCRIVLIKGFDEKGFVFFTNYQSQKGKDLEGNPVAALMFYWHALERQVRIDGRVEKISDIESEDYSNSRPEGSKIGAWSSPQSQLVSRTELLDNQRDFQQKYAGQQIPRPPFWGGYVVKPEMIEFWQGRPNRLHDRIVYQKTGNSWTIQRLAP